MIRLVIILSIFIVAIDATGNCIKSCPANQPCCKNPKTNDETCLDTLTQECCSGLVCIKDGEVPQSCCPAGKAGPGKCFHSSLGESCCFGQRCLIDAGCCSPGKKGNGGCYSKHNEKCVDGAISSK